MATRIRLLVTTSDFVGRGAERELANLLHWLPRERFDIALCLWRDVFDYPCPDDIPITILEKRRPWHVLRVIDRFRQLVKDWKPDLVFSQLNYVSTVTGTALKGLGTNPPWIARLAGNPDVEIRFPILSWTRSSFQRAQRVTGCSEGASRSIARHLRVPANKVETLPNVVDVEAILRQGSVEPFVTRTPDSTVFIHAGRCVPQKDQATLLSAFAKAAIPMSELWMLGIGPLKASLERQAVRLGVADQIRWLEFQPNPYPFFRQADCFVLSSRYEGLPNVVIEAMLSGLPVISTDCPYGPADLVQPKSTGLLTRMGDVSQLAEAMRVIANDKEDARRMGESAARLMAERFSPDRVVPRYVDLFERVVWEASS